MLTNSNRESNSTVKIISTRNRFKSDNDPKWVKYYQKTSRDTFDHCSLFALDAYDFTNLYCRCGYRRFTCTVLGFVLHRRVDDIFVADNK